MECPFYPSPNFTPGRTGKIRSIILHRTYGSTEKTLSWCLNPRSLESYHYIISRDGSIIQLVSCQNVAWHAGWTTAGAVPAHFRGNANDFSVGIACEDCGHGKNQTFYTAEQTKSLIRLITTIKHSFRIRLTPDRLIGHSVIDPKRNPLDPGPYVDWERVMRATIDLKISDHEDLLIKKGSPETAASPNNKKIANETEAQGIKAVAEAGSAAEENPHVLDSLIKKIFHGLLARDPNSSELDYYRYSKLDLAQITRRIVATEEFRKKQHEQDTSKLKLITFLS